MGGCWLDMYFQWYKLAEAHAGCNSICFASQSSLLIFHRPFKRSSDSSASIKDLCLIQLTTGSAHAWKCVKVGSPPVCLWHKWLLDASSLQWLVLQILHSSGGWASPHAADDKRSVTMAHSEGASFETLQQHDTENRRC